MTRFVYPECYPKGIPKGLPWGDARGATRGAYSSSDISPILDRMLFSPSEVRTVSIFLGISLGLCPREIPQKTQSTPPSHPKSNTMSRTIIQLIQITLSYIWRLSIRHSLSTSLDFSDVAAVVLQIYSRRTVHAPVLLWVSPWNLISEGLDQTIAE